MWHLCSWHPLKLAFSYPNGSDLTFTHKTSIKHWSISQLTTNNNSRKRVDFERWSNAPTLTSIDPKLAPFWVFIYLYSRKEIWYNLLREVSSQACFTVLLLDQDQLPITSKNLYSYAILLRYRQACLPVGCWQETNFSQWYSLSKYLLLRKAIAFEDCCPFFLQRDSEWR